MNLEQGHLAAQNMFLLQPQYKVCDDNHWRDPIDRLFNQLAGFKVDIFSVTTIVNFRPRKSIFGHIGNLQPMH